MPPGLAALGPTVCALLVETRAADRADLLRQAEEATRLVEEVKKLHPVKFTDVKAEFEKLWDIRKGLFPAVGGARKIGTTVVIEDVAFPIEHLAAGTVFLEKAMRQHGYAEGIIFGHALDGNLHFTFTQDFGLPAEVARYQALMEEVCDVVVRRFDGSLKGEHGTGRNMAPFVELEWGAKAYGLMRAPQGALRPEGHPEPRRHPERRPQGLPQGPEAPAAGRPAGRQVHRVRLLRAQVPFTASDDHPAPAHHRAAGDRPAGPHRGGPGPARPAGRRLRVPGRADLRHRRPVRHRLPGLHRHRRIREGAAQGRLVGEGPLPGPAARRRLRRHRGLGAPRAGRRRRGPRGPGDAAARRPVPGRARGGGGLAPPVEPGHAPGRPGDPVRERPARQGTAGGLLPVVHRPDHGRPARRRGRARRVRGHAVAPRQGRLRRDLPGRDLVALLRPGLRLQGIPRRGRRQVGGAGAGPRRRQRGRAHPHPLRHQPLPAAHAQEDGPEAAPARAGRVHPRPPPRQAPGPEAAGEGGGPRHLQQHQDGRGREARGRGPRLRHRGGDPAPGRAAAASPGTGASPSPSSTPARCRSWPPGVAGCTEGVSNSRTCEIGLALHAGIPYRSIVFLADRAAARKE